MIFQNNRNVSQKERRGRKNMTIKLIATSLDNGLIKTESETSCSSKPFVLPRTSASPPRVGRYRVGKVVDFRAYFTVEDSRSSFFPPVPSTFTSHSSFRPRVSGVAGGEKETSVSPPTPPCRNSAELGRGWLYIRRENVG